MGPRAGLDRCGRSRPHRDSIPITVQPVASLYTDCVIPALFGIIIIIIIIIISGYWVSYVMF